MSVPSAQCDELRELAARYDELQAGAAKAVTMPSDMGSILREAADTIWELRAENAKLCEELADSPECETCEAMLDCDECLRADGSHKERRRLSDENVKLREIIADLEKLLPESERCYIHETVKAIAENNAKLRELCADMGELLDALTECDLACKHYHDGCIGDCYYVNARRELGMEVEP